MARGVAGGHVVNLHHPDVMRAILEQILTTGDVIGHDPDGSPILAVTVAPWLFDEIAAFGSDLADLEADPDEDDDPAEDEE